MKVSKLAASVALKPAASKPARPMVSTSNCRMRMFATLPHRAIAEQDRCSLRGAQSRAGVPHGSRAVRPVVSGRDVVQRGRECVQYRLEQPGAGRRSPG